LFIEKLLIKTKHVEH